MPKPSFSKDSSGLVWFGLVLCHINHCRLINAKSFLCINIHHHHVALSARIFLTLSRHPSLSSIAFGRSSGLHPVTAQSCCMQVRAGRPAFDRPWEGVSQEYTTYELVPTSPAVSRVSGSSNFDSFRYGW